MDDAKAASGNAIEAHAGAIGCPRHIWQMRACAATKSDEPWLPCLCRPAALLERVLGGA